MSGPLSGPLSIAYVAGLFDGEGSVEIRRAEHYRNPDVAPLHTLRMAIGSTNREVITRLHEQFGGTVYEDKSRVARGHKCYWRWRLSATPTADLLEAMLPHLVIKREQASLAVEYQRHRQAHSYQGGRGGVRVPDTEVALRDDYRNRLRELNTR